MPDAPLKMILSQAIAHHQAGRLPQAAQLYQHILTVEPRHADALRLLGVIAHRFDRPETAVGLLRQAIAVNAAIPEYHNDLALALHALGKYEEADAEYGAALRLNPEFAEAHYNLGNTCKARKRFDEAIRHYREALRIRPGYAEARNNLGNALNAAGRFEEAALEYREAARLAPENADARINYADALQARGWMAEALGEYRAALLLRPGDAEGRRHFADALQATGHLDQAIAEYEASLRADPNQPAGLNNLGTTLKEAGRLEDAAAAYLAALALQGDYAEAWSNLGSVRKDQALLDAAMECFQRAAAAKPESFDMASNLVYMAHFHPAYGPREIAAELARWNDRFARPLAVAIAPHGNERSPERPLRIGWVSPDFRRHPIGRFLLPIFAAHDSGAYPFYGYSDVSAEDAVTHQLRRHAQRWHHTAGLSHEQLAALIRNDGIDILIDLTMHMQKSRLPVFARKPAPIQITYLAYCSSTGMAAMDYRLTDASLETAATAAFCSETPLVLQSYWCYAPDRDVPAVNALPADAAGHVTFGNLNNFCKASPAALEAWAAILSAVPGSRLLLHAAPGSHRGRVRDLFAARGVDPDRCEFVDMLGFDQYMKLYQRIDIALDPFPYGGGTTSCDALWMGVPLVTRAGEAGVGRGGVSLLTQLGLAGLIAADGGAYVERAVELAGDLPRLRELRGAMRGRMERSLLMDAGSMAGDLQGLLRGAWVRWCGERSRL